MAQNITTANASYKKSIGKITSTTSFIASEYNLDPKSNYRNLYTAMEPGYKYSTCSMIKAEELFNYTASKKIALTVGGGYETYSSIPQSADLQSPVDKKNYVYGRYLGTESYYRPEGLPAQFYLIKYHNISTYFQTQYSPDQKIHFTAGARFDINSRYGSTFNPRLGVVYSPFDGTTMKLLFGSAFLAPSPSDSYVQYGSFDTQDSGDTYHAYFLHLPNPGLKPIKSQNAEVSIRQYLSENTSITLDGYYTILTGLHAFADDNTSTHLYNNMFDGIPVDYIEVFVNQNEQKNYGGSIQLNARHSFGNVHMNSYATLSYMNGKIKDGGNQSTKNMQLDFISPFMFHLGTDLTAGKLSFSPRLLLLGKQNLSGISDTTGTIIKRQTIPGYALLNISVRYKVTKGISFFANVTNMLNQHYRSVGFNMDLNNKNSELFYGQREEPVRIMGGLNLVF